MEMQSYDKSKIGRMTQRGGERELPETRESLERLLREAGIVLESARIDQLWTFHTLLRAHNEDFDLTRIRSFRDIVVKHYIDCLLVPTLVRLPSPLLDIGTGAGFPGIPIKIAVPECEIVLAEGRTKRVEFLRLAIDALGLEGISVFGRGILPGRLDRKVGGVITRALETAAETLGRVGGLLDAGGEVILMKGPKGGEEITPALEAHSDEYRLRDDIPYTIKGTRNQRRLIVFEKIAPAAVKAVPHVSSEPASEITSPSNPSFKEWKTLLSGRGIRKHGLALVSGRKIIGDVLSMNTGLARAWIGSKRLDPPPADLRGVPWYILAGELFRELDVHGTGYPLLLVSAPPLREFDSSAAGDGPALLLPFQDPANLGAAIRSAAAFGVRTVVLLREAANPFHPKSIRSSGAAVFLADLFEGPSIESLGRFGIPVVALSAGGADITGFTFPERFALLPGVEGPGLPEGLSVDFTVKIPMAPGVESLNAAATVAVALFEWRRRNPGK
jgi:16S rRNA (guanine(527)-N(7))-methyltransferase RsmG